MHTHTRRPNTLQLLFNLSKVVYPTDPRRLYMSPADVFPKGRHTPLKSHTLRNRGGHTVHPHVLNSTERLRLSASGQQASPSSVMFPQLRPGRGQRTEHRLRGEPQQRCRHPTKAGSRSHKGEVSGTEHAHTCSLIWLQEGFIAQMGFTGVQHLPGSSTWSRHEVTPAPDTVYSV